MANTITELCGEPTPNGKSCNMPKGHRARFHRHRVYAEKVEWRIKTPKTNKVIEYGNGRVELGYAITRVLQNYPNVVIEVESA